jgi:hypothetical protein
MGGDPVQQGEPALGRCLEEPYEETADRLDDVLGAFEKLQESLGPEGALEGNTAPGRAFGQQAGQRLGIAFALQFLELRPFHRHPVLRLLTTQLEQLGLMALQVRAIPGLTGSPWPDNYVSRPIGVSESGSPGPLSCRVRDHLPDLARRHAERQQRPD